MFDRPKSGEASILVYGPGGTEDQVIDELSELARSAGANPVASLVCRRDHVDPAYFIGKGKIEELRRMAVDEEADLIIFNQSLSPSQERNLEKTLGVRVIDRTGLILDIFAQRAQSYEGKLQVELAQLQHLSTRLVRGWTHLERQKGGIGLRGPGETQLETDKRLIAGRITQIRKRLDKVERQRGQGRRARRRSDVPVVGLVGYTNAGKSTLINALTGSGVYAADQLFATLDPTLRRLGVGPDQTVILADTVGFVRDLPHELVAAFRSTLQETVEADLLLHVIDASDPHQQDTIAEVDNVIREIGAESVPQVRVFNKIDRLDQPMARIDRDGAGQATQVWVSARNGQGLDLVRETLRERLLGRVLIRELSLGPADGDLRAQLYRVATVLRDTVDDQGGWRMRVAGTAESLKCLDLRPEIRNHPIEECDRAAPVRN